MVRMSSPSLWAVCAMRPWRTQGASWGGEGAPDLANSEPDVRNLSGGGPGLMHSWVHLRTCRQSRRRCERFDISRSPVVASVVTRHAWALFPYCTWSTTCESECSEQPGNLCKCHKRGAVPVGEESKTHDSPRKLP
jgi:hypothetical protein